MTEPTRNGLRDERGSLIGGLHVFDYVQGMEDFESGNPPPDMTSPSYDLGRQRAAEQAEAKADAKATAELYLKRHFEESDRRMKEILSPEHYAEYRAKMDEIDARKR